MNTQALFSGLVRAADTKGTVEGYMPGFGNDFETEALPGALPQGMNSPQKCNYGLYGEQLSGTAFTAPSHQNERTWCYRIRPSVKHTHRFRGSRCRSGGRPPASTPRSSAWASIAGTRSPCRTSR